MKSILPRLDSPRNKRTVKKQVKMWQRWNQMNKFSCNSLLRVSGIVIFVSDSTMLYHPSLFILLLSFLFPNLFSPFVVYLNSWSNGMYFTRNLLICLSIVISFVFTYLKTMINTFQFKWDDWAYPVRESQWN